VDVAAERRTARNPDEAGSEQRAKREHRSRERVQTAKRPDNPRMLSHAVRPRLGTIRPPHGMTLAGASATTLARPPGKASGPGPSPDQLAPKAAQLAKTGDPPVEGLSE